MNDKVITQNEQKDVSVNPNSLGIDVSKIPNVVLQRLIEEVRHERLNDVTAYNRTHNRHNRGR
ncbi:MAG: YhhA family cyclophane-containing RiPP [Saprospiraceae bacterium]